MARTSHDPYLDSLREDLVGAEEWYERTKAAPLTETDDDELRDSLKEIREMALQDLKERIKEIREEIEWREDYLRLQNKES